METPNPDDELLLILLRNLRNAANTFGEGTPPCEGIRTIVEEHLQAMRKKGLSTNLVEARKFQEQTGTLAASFSNLAIRPKADGGQ